MKMNVFFRLFQNVDVLARRGLIDSSIRGHIMAIDSAQSPEQLQGAYNQASECFAQAAADVLLDPMDQTRLAEANAQLKALTHSRQQGIEFGELFALIIFGGVYGRSSPDDKARHPWMDRVPDRNVHSCCSHPLSFSSSSLCGTCSGTAPRR